MASLQHSSYTHHQYSSTEVDDHEGKSTIEKEVHYPGELPWLIRVLIKVSVGASARNNVLYLLILFIYQVTVGFAVFCSITESIVVGTTISVLGLLSSLSAFKFIGFEKPSSDAATQKIKMQLLFENVERYKNKIKANLVMGFVTLNCIFLPVAYFALVFPKMGAGGSMNYILKEKASWALWLGFALGEVSGTINNIMMVLQEPTMECCSETWARKLQAYVANVHEILVELSSSKDTLKETQAMAAIAAEQKKVESWAKVMNKLFQDYYGLGLVLTLLWVFVPMLVLALNPAVSSVAEVGTLAFMSLMFLGFFAMTLSSTTKPNIAWNQAVTSMLYDARVQNLNVQLVQNRFQPWLDSHEINASRAYGMKVTVRGLQRLLTTVASLFTVLMYFILREELRTML
eukprot:g3684.t1